MTGSEDGPRNGKFIVLEGIDGAGKTTQARRLVERLAHRGSSVYATHEPSDGPIGGVIRQVLSGRITMDEPTLALMYAADRLDHLTNERNGILAITASGRHVICDRYYMSSLVYHSGGVCSLEWIALINRVAIQLLKPDMTVLLDVPPEVAYARLGRARFVAERYEALDRLARVHARYAAIAATLDAEHPVVHVDGSRPIAEVGSDIIRLLGPLIGSGPGDAASTA
jgi:dTMP kinase